MKRMNDHDLNLRNRKAVAIQGDLKIRIMKCKHLVPFQRIFRMVPKPEYKIII